MSLDTSYTKPDLSQINIRIRIFDMLIGIAIGTFCSLLIAFLPGISNFPILNTSGNSDTFLKVAGVTIAVIVALFWIRMRMLERVEQLVYKSEIKAVRSQIGDVD